MTGRRRGTHRSAAQELRLELAQLGRRRGAELVAQPRAQVLVDPERLGPVAARDEDPHEEDVGVLAERRRGDELAGTALARRELGTADPERHRRLALERGKADVLEPATVLLG